ncbi:NAD(P)-dependent oxidoreductase [Pedobacter cryophilus]|uniref:2-hydroxyacid dehydrogenase n=1 Tax=Pedobacter cryophilus TaxID=2571271 RepID=A0A4U1C0R7_9SPHI|nr:NAD(P)-dependent oxidoreductase [Pedobacter cryophilus]TKB99122.1 2-hydroxyacid dehydrogenase [Pedobacter cryophilus]
MKVVEYSTRPFEKESLAKANHKKHDITLISNSLSEETTFYAQGKDAVIVSVRDTVSAPVINKLASYGVKYITTRSYSTAHIDTVAAKAAHIKIAHLPENYLYGIVEHALSLVIALNTKFILSPDSLKISDNSPEKNIFESVVGIIGMGDFGQVTANVFESFGYKVIYHDIQNSSSISLDQLYATADIISLHIPLNEQTKHIINSDSLAKMKDGVMLINTSKGDLVQLTDVLAALNKGKLGFLGMDVYDREFPKAQDKYDAETLKNPVLQELMVHPHALIIPYQEFLTSEILQEIAEETIHNLDQWQVNKCLGKACSCAKDCKVENVAPVNSQEKKL